MKDESTKKLFNPVQTNDNLYVQVVNQIMDLIQSGLLSPGDKLPSERKLAEDLNISRPVLREACRVLEIRGLLITRPGGGRFIRDIPESINIENMVQGLKKAALIDVLEARLITETETTALAALRANPDDIAEMENLCDLFKNDFEKFKKENGGLKFHFAVARASRNFVLQTIGEIQIKLSHDLEQDILLGLEKWKHLNCEHIEILNAIKAKDPNRASSIMRNHILGLIEAMKQKSDNVSKNIPERRRNYSEEFKS